MILTRLKIAIKYKFLFASQISQKQAKNKDTFKKVRKNKFVKLMIWCQKNVETSWNVNFFLV